jgi:uncharacterized protein with ParB-like and HNH nuclease domain
MEIKSIETIIENLFHGTNTIYEVPHYQRDYSWNVENVDELWHDIFNSYLTNDKYFLGAILLNNENKADSSYDIVDGQQRLATFTILLSVIRGFSKTFIDDQGKDFFNAIDKANPDNESSARRVAAMSENRIVQQSDSDFYFLRLNKKDQPIFFSEIQRYYPIPDSTNRVIKHNENRLLKAKKQFIRHVQENIINKSDGFRILHDFYIFLVKKLVFLRIDVTTDSDAYILFETLNNRGADLSISDLVKNRLLISCSSDPLKRDRVLDKWDKIVEALVKSRYQTHDFLRFYWIAFKSNATKKDVYNKIKQHLSIPGKDAETLVDDLLDNAEIFSKITDRQLTYPVGLISYSNNSIEQYFAEINYLGYSVCYPLLLVFHKLRPGELVIILPVIISYLFRLITIGDYSAGRAEKAFLSALSKTKDSKPISEIIECFSDPETADSQFKKKISENTIEDNKIAKYLLAKVSQSQLGTALQLKSTVQLEHVLPIKNDKWVSFNAGGRQIKDCTFSIGNMTLLEAELNAAIKNDTFENKVKYYKKRTVEPLDTNTASSIPMTYEIHDELSSMPNGWTGDKIFERANKLAQDAVTTWPATYTEIVI